MVKLIDKLAIIFIGIISTLLFESDALVVFSNLFAIALSCINTLFKNKLWINYLTLIIFGIFCCFSNASLFIFAILFYDFDYLKHKINFILPALIIAPLCLDFSWLLFTLTILNLMFSIIISIKTTSKLNKEQEFFDYQNKVIEQQIKQTQIDKVNSSNRYEEIAVAKLQERNSIAIEIHDNVGHILSSSILLTGALIATNKESDNKESLITLKQNLQSAMQSIRESVHNNIQNEILNLRYELNKIIDDFTFCEIDFRYDINSWIFGKEAMYIISIVKESLTNTIKHSNATNITVSLKEHPSFFQIIVKDNGTTTKDLQDLPKLISIKENTFKLNGTLNISTKSGFEVFVSFPKRNIEL